MTYRPIGKLAHRGIQKFIMTGLAVLKVCIGSLLQSATFTTACHGGIKRKHTVAKSSIQLENLYMCNNVPVKCLTADVRTGGVLKVFGNAWLNHMCWAPRAEIIGNILTVNCFTLEFLVLPYSCNWQPPVSVTVTEPIRHLTNSL